MTKLYSEEATIRIWRNVKNFGKIPTRNFGHAALTLKGDRIGRCDGNWKEHISFWPDADTTKSNSLEKQASSWSLNSQNDAKLEMNLLTAIRLEVGYCIANEIEYPALYDKILKSYNKMPLDTPRDGQVRQKRESNEEDDWIMPVWSQSAEEKIRLPGIGAFQRVWGLSLPKMQAWWASHKKSTPYYQAFGRKNCAGIVLKALKEGGSEAFVPCPNITFYAEPRQVEDYAKRVLAEIEHIETLTKEFNDKQGRDKLPMRRPGDELFSTEQWKRASALGSLQVRSTTIRQIDNALAKYHATSPAQFRERYAALVQIFLGVLKHRQEKQDSARSEAVLRLGGQVLDLMREEITIAQGW